MDPLATSTGARYVYASGNPVTGSDPSGLATLGFCGDVGAAWGIQTGGLSGCLVRTVNTAHDEIGLVGSVAAGPGLGVDFGGGIGIQVSNSETLGDLRGPFAYFTIAGEFFGGAFVTVFWGQNTAGELIYGLEVGPALGEGAKVSVGVSKTGVTTLTGIAADIAKFVYNQVFQPSAGYDLLALAREAIAREAIAGHC